MKIKKHQFKYIFLLFTLILFGVVSFVYSEDAPEQSNGEQNLTDQSDDEPIPTEQQPPKELNLLKKQFIELKSDVVDLKRSLDAMQDRLNNPFQTFLMIFGTIIVITIVGMFFLSIRKIRQLRNRFENSQRQWTDRSKENDQRSDAKKISVPK